MGNIIEDRWRLRRPTDQRVIPITTCVLLVLMMTIVTGGALSVEILDASCRTNSSTTSRTFSFERQISWLKQDFLVREIGGPDQLQVRSLFNDPQNLQAFRILVSGPQKREFSIGLELEPTINKELEWCGYKQTYRTSDGIDYDIDPRGWLTDRWTIKRGPILAEDYEWKRNPMGLAGPIKDQQGRHVAHFHARTWGHQWIAMSWHSKSPHTTTYTIVTNDEIPIEYLVGLFTVAIIRMDKCGR
ncbi:hypothetical protein PGTUg99_034891 [Puccinia graminis f. sp. tritici]|uniref:Uncharacterized protein n=1 Tax=Puccinia graminis f. sp. tritici TaxID=56615 RepID=A0A5B0PP93_PUCGR|nr:hypothetical protein PGTUg99_034891 [Puccinia graminis f. sp. tritici]